MALGLEVTQADAAGGTPLELTTHLGMRKEHQGLDEGGGDAAKGPLAREQTFQPLALPVREEHGVVLGVPLPLVIPGPDGLVARHGAGTALDFGEEGALRTDDQQVHLIDGTILRDEFEVRPGEIIVLRREVLEDKIQRLLLPREAGGGDGLPVLLRHVALPV
jgi:hypothetical protein